MKTLVARLLRTAGCCGFLLSAALYCPMTLARTHALLIGVSEYPQQANWTLQGPRNDVQLFRELLLERNVSPADITIVADGVQGGSLPTRAAILDALRALEKRVSATDLVFILMAGHGTQRDVTPSAAEPDGRDEMFMPRDTSKKSVTNAISDDELGIALNRLRARGAFVWGVFDTCFAGTITRTTSAVPERERYIPPEELGLSTASNTAKLPQAPGAASRVTPSASPLSDTTASAGGDYIYMYAAQSYEKTSETVLPRFSPFRQWHGRFSHTLYQVLARNPAFSYRQVMEGILQTYIAAGVQESTPLLEGTALDAGVFSNVAPRVQWRVHAEGKQLLLAAGQLLGVYEGSTLALVASPEASDAEILGYGKVLSSTLNSATLEPVAYGKLPVPSLERWASSTYARPVDLTLDFRLRVGLPGRGTPCAPLGTRVGNAVEELRRQRSSRLLWTPPGELADVYLCERSSRLLFLDYWQRAVDRTRDPIPGMPLASVTADELDRQLRVITKATNIARVAAAHLKKSHLDTTLLRRAPCPGECAPEAYIRVGEMTRLRTGDVVTVTVGNPRKQPVDVTMLHVDAAYGVACIYPRGAESSRLEPDTNFDFNADVTADPSGLERLIVITLPAQPLSPIVSFCSLAQDGLDRSTRGTHGNLLDLLEEAAFDATPFSTSRSGPIVNTDIGVAVYGWTVEP